MLHVLDVHRAQGRAHALLCCRFRQYARLAAIHGLHQAERLIAAGKRRLTAICSTEATIIRLDPEVLAVVVPGPSTEAEVLELAERCTDHCRPLEEHGDDPPLLLSVAIGAALASPVQPLSSAALLSQAQLARLEAETRPGHQLVLAATAIQHLAEQRYQRESALHLALQRGELLAYLQPIVNLRDGQAIGFECLARWPMASGRLATPAEFLSHGHDSGITAEIDLQVIGACLAAAAQLAQAAGRERPLILSANISAQLIESPRQVAALLKLIQANPLPPTVQLQLELLEESLNNADCKLDALLEWLSEQRVLIAIDDFGTGYSSLSRLHDLAINTVKVDRSFIRRINAEQKPSNHLLKTLVAMSHDLQMSLTAEGIETEAQRQWLLQEGVEHGQGFLFSRPLSLADAIDYLGRDNSSERD